ncbi:MAG: bifunctional folylpolyglutamate synthase/dihydrofolate synthase [Kiritimatiellae bacterium]|nr:bifunctional folylpolyglutamate synthase/dihydrofolate synthase [Kiritimatiellia bacterium]
MTYLEELASRRRFGMRASLEGMEKVLAALGNPEKNVKAIHIAGTNGKGAVAAMLDSALRACGFKVARYTSPHLVRLNERFFIQGEMASDAILEEAASRVAAIAPEDLTFFEALTAVAYLVFAASDLDYAVIETGLGGRLDATNVCRPSLSIITKIGLDHCDWLGDTEEKIAVEKGGIIKKGIPVLLGRNSPAVRETIRAIASERSSRFVYAPDLACAEEIPAGFSLKGAFNRENAVTALAALKVLQAPERALGGFSNVVWPGRYHRTGNFIIDGAHNPPAASALASALAEDGERDLVLIAGFCADKDVDETLLILKPFCKRAIAVKTNNPRSLEAETLSARMRGLGFAAESAPSLAKAIEMAGGASTLVCGSLFLAGEALVALGAYPWPDIRFDPSETLK